MIFEIGSSIVMAGVAGYSYLKTSGPATNDAEKIQRVFANSGLTIKENGRTKTIRLHRKRKIESGTEYVFQLPLGMSSKQIIDHQHVIEDGLNIRTRIRDVDLSKLLQIKWDRTALEQIKKILSNTTIARKEVEIDFDGMLRIYVHERELATNIDWDDSMIKPGSWSVPIGSERSGMIYHDFDKRKHLIVAGATGFGKSVVLKTIVTSLIMSKQDDVSFTLIDLKGGSAFNRFKDAKQVEHFGKDPKEASAILTTVQKKMNAAYEEIVEGGFEDITEAGIEKRHFIIIDEGADIAGDAKTMDVLTDIVRKGRGAGFYVVYSTQYPTAQSVPMAVKRNIPARLCFILDSATASMAVLDRPGAEDLPEIPGRGIYKEVKQRIVQTPYMTNKQIEDRVRPHVVIKARGEKTDEQKSDETTKDRKYSIEFEKV